MEQKIFHAYSNGAIARNLIINNEDFNAAFNRIGVCVAVSPVRVLGASIQNTHLHMLIKGGSQEVSDFIKLYMNLTSRYIAFTRGNRDGVRFEMDISTAEKPHDPFALKRIANYVISQPTKDGRHVLPYYYRWSTASLYFKPEWIPSLWHYDENQVYLQERRFGDLSCREKKTILHSHIEVPAGWKVCGQTVLPENYVDVHAFEDIYGTPNSFTVFMGSTSSQIDTLKAEMAGNRGVTIEDLDARKFCREMCIKMFGHGSIEELAAGDRLKVAMALKRKYRLSARQLATITRISSEDIENIY